MVVAFASAIAANIMPGLAQPIGAVGSVKVVALFMLFTYVFSTGQGMKILVGVVLLIS